MKQIWNLEELKIKNAKEKLEKLIKKIQAYQNKTLDDTAIYKILQTGEEIAKITGPYFSYFQLKFSENNADKKILQELNKLSNLSTEISDKLRFFNHQLLKKNQKELQKLIENPKLKKYKVHLKRIVKSKKYMLNEKTEQIIDYKSKASSTLVRLYDLHTDKFTYDASFKKNMTEEQLKKYTRSKNYEERKEAYDTLLEKYKKNEDLLSEMYKGIVKDYYLEITKIRNYKTPISSSNFDNEITDKATNALIKSVQKNNHIFVEYRKIKSKILGKDHKNNRYNLYAPLKKSKNYTFKYSIDLLGETLKEFDSEIYNNYNKLIAKKHIHSHPEKNKRGGAFCLAPGTKTIPYILLNHVDNLDSYMTLSHETGHALHYMLSSKQGEYYNSPPLVLAETASIFTETLAAKKELEKGTIKDKINTLIYVLDQEYASIVRQTYFTIFEQRAHENINSDSDKTLNEIYYETLQEQFPEQKVPQIFKYEWLHIPHIYHNPFYCYSYAFGNLLTLSLIQSYEKDENYKHKIIDFLKAGSKDETMDILKIVNFNPEKEADWDKGFKQIKKQIETLKKLATQLNK